MCLSRKFTIKDKKKWLKNQPEIIIAYKIVEIIANSMKSGCRNEYGLYPYFFKSEPFKKINLLKEIKSKKSSKIEHTYYKSKAQRNVSYIAYYHLGMDKEKLREMFKTTNSLHLIKCKVPKKYITDIGEQWNMITIVTRKFTIVGQNEYLSI